MHVDQNHEVIFCELRLENSIKPNSMANSGSHTNYEVGDKPLELPINRHRQKEPTASFNKPRDPRFDPRCAGSNDVRHFVRNYAFLDDVRKEEISELQKALNKEKDPEKRKKIKMTVSRIRNKVVERNNKKARLELVSELKQAKGGKYRNVKKSEIKEELMARKFNELKETGKLTKYLERKRKKLIKRDGKALG